MYSTEVRKVRRARRKADSANIAKGTDPGEWVRRMLGFSPDEVQEHVLATSSRRVLLNCTRQWGKSTVTAAKAIHQAHSMPGSLTLVVSPSARQSGEFLRKAEEFARRLNIKPKGDGDNDISLMLPNRSRIVGLPGREATIRGFSAVGLLLVCQCQLDRHPSELEA